NRPGSYALSLVGGAGSQPGVQFPNLAQAIEQAGGITLSADIRRVQLRRLQRLGSEDVITIDLLELVQTGNSPQNLKLRDGDTIFIPTSTNVTLSEIQQIAATGFAPKPDEPRTVAVVGEVTRPGSYVVIGGNTRTSERTLGLPTVTRAIQLAGGIKPMANIRQIQVRRLTRSGTEQIIAVDLWQLLQSGDFNQDTILQDRDTIFVPTAPEMSPSEATELATVSFSPDTIQVSVVGEVIRPGVVQVPPNTPLNQALLTAGGFDQNRASKSSVELIRLNPDGTVSKRTVPIDLAQGINEESNPILRNNDIIVVDRSNVVRVTDSIQTTLQPVDRVFGFLNILRLLGIFF
ncbi:MAG TPA: polysaccharide export protein, partial [Cyanobacteria bacterium UBA11162]|nr:polysaccharide export protein [Cyanobacteria bacterium UBA11162]